MKRLIAVLSGLLVLPAFAEIAPVFYDDVIEYADQDFPGDEIVDAVEEDVSDAPAAAPVVPQKPSPRTSNTSSTGRTAVSRAVPSASATGARTQTSGRAVASTGRSVSTRGAASNNLNTARTAVAARTGSNTATTASGRAGAAVNSRSAATVSPRTTRTSNSGATTARAGLVQTDTVNTPLYTGRVGVRGSTSVAARVPAVRASSSTAVTTAATSTVDATSMDELAQLTDFCKAQYTQCMDNFCNVLDDNQGRCSCSKNLKNYEKTETALKQATEELQEVAQKIQYIGLSKDEVETLFSQTEAENAMQGKTDNTQLNNSLEQVKNMIIGIKPGSVSTTDNGFSFDLNILTDFSFGTGGIDLSSLFGTSNATSSISNQRGETLYKTATARCKASVLNSCTAQGVDASIITNAYDLEIDKQCIAYERSLTDSNDQMSATVRNAKSVLQKARLMVAQQKNTYADMRSCINALDSCMQDEFVCGSDYESCLDPTGKYIVGGEIVDGSTPGVSGGELSSKVEATDGLYKFWNYEGKNAWGKDGSLGAFIDSTMSSNVASISNPTDMTTYLQSKIGYIDKNGKAQGMCVSVLNKCQNYTYTGNNNKTYNDKNDVVKGYLERVLVQIKAAQDEKLADYAESCIAGVASCLSQNNFNYGNTNYYGSSTDSTPSATAIRACASKIIPCQSVNGWKGQTGDITEWLNEALGYQVGLEIGCKNSGGTWTVSNNSGTCNCGTGKTFNPTKRICEENKS